MNYIRHSLFALMGLYLIAFSACSTDFEVNAPPKDIIGVFCVLNPADSIQYVRIGASYQVEGDAEEYAAENDLSIKGLVVKLKTSGQEFTAIEVDSFPKDVGGIFYPYMTMYQIMTPSMGGDGDTIIPGKEYTLEIGTPEDSIYITGKTKVPSKIRLKDKLSPVPAGGTTMKLQRIDLTRDYDVQMNRGDNAHGYELRVSLKYEADGVPKEVSWGPTAVFTSDVRCASGSSEICYELTEWNLLSVFRNALVPDAGVVYTYDETESADESALHLLSHAFEFEMTALDEQMYTYMLVNDPKIVDLSGSRPEYSSLTGNVETIGIFGSITTDTKWALMSKCSQYHLGLNGTAKPTGCMDCFPE